MKRMTYHDSLAALVSVVLCLFFPLFSAALLLLSVDRELCGPL